MSEGKDMLDTTWNRLNLMSQNRDLSNEERLHLILNSGCDVLNMSIGILTRIEGDKLAVVFASNNKWRDAQFSLYQTLCQFTVEYGDVIASHNLADTNLDEFGVIEPLQFGAYIGIPIMLDGQLYGTLFFARKKPRYDDFTDREQAFLKILSTSVRNVIQQELVRG